MNPEPPYIDYTPGGFILIAAAAVILLFAVMTGRSDLMSATLILSGAASFAGGVFILTFSRGDPVDPRITSLMAVPGTVTVSRLCNDLGAQGNARFIPTGKEILQFVPVDEDQPNPKNFRDFTYSMDEAGCGILIPPASTWLLELLREKHKLRLPEEEDLLFVVIAETIEDVLELADRAKGHRSGENILINLTHYRLFDGCSKVQAISPECCTTAPCPVCSLIACMVALGLKQTIVMERVALNSSDSSIMLYLRICK